MFLNSGVRYSHYLEFVLQLLAATRLKGSFEVHKESCCQDMAKYCLQYFMNNMQASLPFSLTLSLSFPLSLSDFKRKPSFSYSYLMHNAIFIMQPLRAFKIMMCLGIFNFMGKVPTVLIVARREGCQPEEAKSMEN